MNRDSFLSSIDEVNRMEGAKLYDVIEKAREDKFVSSGMFHKQEIWKKAERMGIPGESAFFGLPLGERKVFINPSTYPQTFITLISIENLYEERKLRHKDYLGAVMALGMIREKFSDFVVKDNKAYVLTFPEIYNYLKENLVKVGNNGVEVKEEDFNLIEKLLPNLIEINITIASSRLDVLVSEITGLSRSKAEELLREGQCLINGAIEKEKDLHLEEDDFLTIRKYGKFIIGKDLGESRKGKIRKQIKKYVD